MTLAPIEPGGDREGAGAGQRARRGEGENRDGRDQRERRAPAARVRKRRCRSPLRQPSRGPNGTRTSSATKIGAKVIAK